jgi:hypothetical protein
MNSILINQTFASKTLGQIGRLDLVANIDEVLLNGEVLSERSVQYLLAYGVRQAFTDCYSQAKTTEKAVEMFNKKTASVIAGTISLRETLDPRERIINELTLEAFKKSAKMTFAQFKKSLGGTDEGDAKAEAVLDKFAESIRAEVEVMADERIARESPVGEKANVSVLDILNGMSQPVTTVIKQPKAKKSA